MVPWLIAIVSSLSALGTAMGSGGPPIFSVGLVGAVFSGIVAWTKHHTLIEMSLWVLAWSVGWATAAVVVQFPALYNSLGVASLPGVLLVLPLYAMILFLSGWLGGIFLQFLRRSSKSSNSINGQEGFTAEGRYAGEK